MGTRAPVSREMDDLSAARECDSSASASGLCLLCQLPSTSKDTPAQQCLCSSDPSLSLSLPLPLSLPVCETTPVIGEAAAAEPGVVRRRKTMRSRAAAANATSRKQLFRQESPGSPEWDTTWVVDSDRLSMSRQLDEDDDDDMDMTRDEGSPADTSPGEGEGEGEASTSADATAESVKTKRRKKKVKLSGRHVCRVCSKVFGSPGKLSQHMYAHTGEKPFECVECPKAFSSKFKLVRHHLIHSEERQYRCSMCERTFHRKDHLKNHLKVHSPVKKTFRCDRPDCVKVYSSYLSYRKHTAFHAAEEGHLDCKMCGKSFSSKEQIEYHLKVHSGSRTVKNPSDKKFSCSHCDRKFFTRKDVRRHLVVHTGKRDFLCQFCPQRFGRKDHLVRHIKKSHNVGMGAALRAAASRGKRIAPAMSTETAASVSDSNVTGVVPTVGVAQLADVVQGPDDLLSSVDSVLSASASSSSSNQLLLDDETKTTAYQIVEHIKQERAISPASHVTLLEPLPAFKLERVKEDVVAVPVATPVTLPLPLSVPVGDIASPQGMIPVYAVPPPSAYSQELPFKQESEAESEAASLEMVLSVGQIDAAVKVVPSSISPLLPSLEENHYMPSLSSESNAAVAVAAAAVTEADAESVLPGPEFLTQLSAEEVFRLLDTDLSANAPLPLPRFNQAFQQQPPP